MTLDKNTRFQNDPAYIIVGTGAWLAAVAECRNALRAPPSVRYSRREIGLLEWIGSNMVYLAASRSSLVSKQMPFSTVLGFGFAAQNKLNWVVSGIKGGLLGAVCKFLPSSKL